uniref:Type I restriction modification DNA specificity domain-containing protein n=1 Tax=Ignavibacterium album TaxID=591197 RepID=A0A832DFE8_9BACT
MTQIKQIKTDKISEDQFHLRHQRSIPKHWSWVKLGDVCEILDNKRVPVNSEERERRIAGKPLEKLFPYFGATGQVGYIDDYLLEGEYVLLGEDGAPFLERNKTKAYIVNGKFWVNNHAHILLSKKNNKFLCYYLNYIDYHPFVTGTTRLKLNQTSMKQIPVIDPPLSEQKKIVEKIEELFSSLDSGVASLKKAKEQIRLYRQSVLASAFNGKLIDNQEYVAKLIKDVFELIDGDRGPNYPKRQDYRETGHCLFLSTKNVRPNGFLFNEVVFIDEKKHKELRKGTLSKGDIILTTRGTVGNVAYYDDSVKYDVVRINSGMLILRMKEKNYLPKFVIYYVQSPQFNLQIKQKITGTAQPQLPANILKGFSIPIPSIAQQTQIVEEIEKRFSEADNLEKAIDESLEKSETLRQSILKQAFEGKLV